MFSGNSPRRSGSPRPPRLGVPDNRGRRGALTDPPWRPRSKCARRPDGRSPLRRGEESPGSTEVRCRVTPGGGDPRDSATERTPPNPLRRAGRAARVKRCGKSAPHRRQRRRQGKPHREQDQVGAAGIRGAIRRCRASLRAAARVGRTRRPATGVPEEWPSPLARLIGGRHRTRLMRRLAPPRWTVRRTEWG
jgi:hypothetical protein